VADRAFPERWHDGRIPRWARAVRLPARRARAWPGSAASSSGCAWDWRCGTGAVPLLAQQDRRYRVSPGLMRPEAGPAPDPPCRGMPSGRPHSDTAAARRPGDASLLTEALDDLAEGDGDHLVTGRIGVDVRPDGRQSAHPGALTDPGGVERHGAHAWERGGVREVRRAEGGLHVSDRNAEGPEAGVEQRVEGDVEVDASGACRHFRWRHPPGTGPFCGRQQPIGSAGPCRSCAARGGVGWGARRPG
jgi:hypothetical protein